MRTNNISINHDYPFRERLEIRNTVSNFPRAYASVWSKIRNRLSFKGLYLSKRQVAGLIAFSIVLLSTGALLGRYMAPPVYGRISSMVEAIEVSLTTAAVREVVAVYASSEELALLRVSAEYWDPAFIQSLWDQQPGVHQGFPADHGVWRVLWEEPGGDGVTVLQYLDEMTGVLLYQEYLWFG